MVISYLPVIFFTVQKSRASNVMTMTNMNTVLVNFIENKKYLKQLTKGDLRQCQTEDHELMYFRNKISFKSTYFFFIFSKISWDFNRNCMCFMKKYLYFYAMKARILKANVKMHAIGCPDLDKSYADVPTGNASLSRYYLC